MSEGLVFARPLLAGAVGSGPVVGVALVFVLGIAAQWLAWRLRLPSILVLLLVGFAAGPDRLGWIDPDALFGDLLLPIVSLAAALILFEGGLSLALPEVRPHRAIVTRLVTVGLLATGVLSALLAHLLMGLPMGVSVLLGAILTVSGPTVVVPLLRHIRPRGSVGTILKWEGIVIDPIGAALAVLVYEGLVAGGPREAIAQGVANLVLSAAVGSVLGVASAVVMIFLLRRYWLPDQLHNPFALALVVGTFTAANAMAPESGLLAVTVFGVLLANRAGVSVRHIVEFKENLRVLLIAGVFIVLAARLETRAFAGLGAGAYVFVAALILVVRPLAVLLSAHGSPLKRAEKLLLAWMFPRGIVAAAVASVFALQLASRRPAVPGAELLVPIVFLVIVGTVLVYGMTAPWLARRTGLATANPQGVLLVGAHAWAREIAKALRDAGILVRLVDTNRGNLAAARMEGIPTWYGNALSESALTEIDFSDLGRLCVLTPNDEVNTLIGLHFLHIFGRGRVYQLPPERSRGTRTEVAPRDLPGRLLFGADATFWDLAARFERGATVKSTNLTGQFGYEEFRERYGPGALLLFAIRDGTLTVATEDQPMEPGAGQTLVALVDAPEAGAEAPRPRAPEEAERG